MISIEDIIYNHKLINFEYLTWSKFQYEYNKYGYNYIDILFNELNCDRYNKSGQQLMSIKNYDYPIIVTSIIKILDNLNDYVLYNDLHIRLCNLHRRNVDVCEEYDRQLEIKKKTVKNKVKKTKVKDEYIRSVSTDLFTGEPKYIYSNLKTGNEIISDNPDLLEELNKPKEKKKKDRTPKVLSLPIGFTFKLNK